MKLSIEARRHIEKALAKSLGGIFRVYGVPGLCGTSSGSEIAHLEEHDLVVTIDGIQIAVDYIIQERMNEVAIHVDEYGLVFLGLN